MRTSLNSRSRLLSKSLVGGVEDGVEIGHVSHSLANCAMMRAQARMPVPEARDVVFLVGRMGVVVGRREADEQAVAPSDAS